MRITLREIAKRAGVSVATVSLALRGRGEVARDRAENIRAIAEAMGYRPNPLRAALASKRFSNSKDLQGTPIAIFEFPALPKKDRLPVYRGAIKDQKAFLHWFHAHRPEAVVGFRVGQYWYLRDEGIRIPEQVGFASLHLSEQDAEIAGGASAIH